VDLSAWAVGRSVGDGVDGNTWEGDVRKRHFVDFFPPTEENDQLIPDDPFGYLILDWHGQQVVDGLVKNVPVGSENFGFIPVEVKQIPL
jgi:hypothetical protein